MEGDDNTTTQGENGTALMRVIVAEPGTADESLPSGEYKFRFDLTKLDPSSGDRVDADECEGARMGRMRSITDVSKRVMMRRATLESGGECGHGNYHLEGRLYKSDGTTLLDSYILTVGVDGRTHDETDDDDTSPPDPFITTSALTHTAILDIQFGSLDMDDDDNSKDYRYNIRMLDEDKNQVTDCMAAEHLGNHYIRDASSVTTGYVHYFSELMDNECPAGDYRFRVKLIDLGDGRSWIVWQDYTHEADDDDDKESSE